MRFHAILLAVLAVPVLAGSEPLVTRKGTSSEGGLKNTITVTVRGLGPYLDANKITNPKYVLYLQGTAFPNLAVSDPAPGHDDLHFYLDRVDANREQWSTLLRNPLPLRKVPLTVGLEKGITFPSEVDEFQLRIYHPRVLYAGGVLFLILLALFVWMARQSDVLREAGPPPRIPRPGAAVPRRAYSLARVQMAVWFFVIAASFVLIWMITFGLDSISPNVLALIGISTGTGLAAAVVDGSKLASLKAKRDELLAEDSTHAATVAALAAKPQPLAPEDVQKQQLAIDRHESIAAEIAEIDKQIDTPAHESLIMDILSDANGISFHRFQMAVWTVILVMIFLVSVWRDLVMPDFSPTLLGLLSISSGTYLGFKFPEAKN